jgi:uncharacterized membrane protein
MIILSNLPDIDWYYHGFNLVLVYMIAGTCGTLWENILYAVREHRFVYSNGSIATPFNFVYGLGGVVICSALCSLENYPWAVYLVGSLLGGATEYLVSVLEEIICHSRSWDYSGRLLSIRGRTTVPIMLGWGLLCLFIVYALYIPFIRHVIFPSIVSVPYNGMVYGYIMIVCASFIIWDLFWVMSLMIRRQQRVIGRKPFGPIGMICDKLFPDSYVNVHFPNAQMRREYLIDEKIVKQTQEGKTK